jgi:translation initiation factor 3 subunit H
MADVTAAAVAARRLPESESKIEVVQIDGLVVMKLIKHCHEVDLANQGIAQGALLGLVADTRLEITHSFPFPAGNDESVDDEDFQLAVMRRLRMVNVDHLHVGWYQSAHFGNFLSPQLLESHFAYQTSIEESVCLIFDTAKTSKGFLSLKAFRLTPQAVELYKAGDFLPDTIRLLKVSYDNLFQEVPIVIRNSHLVNELLLELSEQIPIEAGTQFLDLGTADVLESQLKHLMDTVDELNQEAIKFNKYQNMAVKQFQDKTRFLQKRQLENTARSARGEETLVDEDLNKLFKPIVPPSRLNSMILSGQILSTSEQVSQFCSQSLAKWFGTEALQEAKTSQNAS